MYRDAGDAAACPRCPSGALRPLAFGALEVRACEGCGGVFADRDAMDRVLSGDTSAFRELADEATRAPPRPVTASSTPACPKCQSSMTPVRVERARCIVDVCRAHGVWFDRWEAQGIADAMQRTRTRARHCVARCDDPPRGTVNVDRIG